MQHAIVGGIAGSFVYFQKARQESIAATRMKSKKGDAIDFYLSATRHTQAAKRSIQKYD
jgi:hypothetical protein